MDKKKDLIQMLEKIQNPNHLAMVYGFVKRMYLEEQKERERNMNKKQQTLNPEAAVEMVIKMQDRQTNAIEILSGLILQFEQINYVLHKIDEATCETGKGVDDAWNMLKNRDGIWQGANIVQTYMSSFEKNIADVIELIDTEDITGYIPAEKTDRA